MSVLPATPEKPTKKAPRKPGKMSQERIMLLFIGFFFLGIALLVLLPEGHPARIIAMVVYSVLVFGSMFRLGI